MQSASEFFPQPIGASLTSMGMIAAAAFICTPIAVWDGDDPVWCAESPKIRIANISARELDGSCRRGHPCPNTSGVAARNALVGLFGGATGRWETGHIKVLAPAMRCSALGDSYGRTVATCTLADGRDLGRAMIARGTVARW